MFSKKGIFGSFLVLLCGVLSLNAVGAILSQAEIEQKCFGQGSRRVSVPENCDQFIQCIYGQGSIYDCPTSEPCFDEDEQKCLTTDECSCQTKLPDWITIYCQQKEDSWGAKVPAEDCSKFYMCMGPYVDPISIECPNGYHYSRIEENCVTPLKAGCKGLKGMCFDEPDGFTFPGLKCAQYYECGVDKESPILKTCDVGFHFDGSTGRCVSLTYSSCVDETTDGTTHAPDTTMPTTTQTTTTPATTTSTSASTTTTSTTAPTTTTTSPTTKTTTTTASTTTTTMPTTTVFAPVTCSVANEGHSYPHEDCNKFYICIRSQPLTIHCGANNIYDDIRKMCRTDFEHRCVSRK